MQCNLYKVCDWQWLNFSAFCLMHRCNHFVFLGKYKEMRGHSRPLHSIVHYNWKRKRLSGKSSKCITIFVLLFMIKW